MEFSKIYQMIYDNCSELFISSHIQLITGKTYIFVPYMRNAVSICLKHKLFYEDLFMSQVLSTVIERKL